MEHADFVEKYNTSQIKVHVHRDKAGFLYGQPGLIPENLGATQAMIRTVAFGGLILGLALFFFVPWWVAVIVVVFALYIFPIAQKNAMKGVLEAALRDQYVYQVALERQVIVLDVEN